MKNLSFLFFSLLAVTMFTSCVSNSEPEHKRIIQDVLNTRVIDGNEVVFSQNEVTIEFDNTAQTIKFTTSYKDADGVSQPFTSPTMSLTPVGGSIYEFSTVIGTAIHLFGNIDAITNMVWYEFVNSDYNEVISTTQFIYSYADITVTNPDNGQNMRFGDSQCAFIIDAKGESCSMIITRFIPSVSGRIYDQITWSGLKLTPNTWGYHITADTAVSQLNISYNATDLDITISSQGNRIDGSFNCNDHLVTISGSLFPPRNIYYQ